MLKQRPVYLDLARIRLPLPGLVSILHRVSGAFLFLVGIPLLLAGLAASLESPDLRQHAVEALPLKAISKGEYDKMDGYQWILAAAAHTERHTKQILEVRADANFPAK